MELSDAAIGAILATGAILLCALLLVALLLAWVVSVVSRHRKLWLETDDDGETRAGLELRARRKPEPEKLFPWSESEGSIAQGQSGETVAQYKARMGLDGNSS